MSNRTRRKGCARKSFLSKDAAYTLARHLWKREEFFTVYRCQFCSGWHIARHKRARMELLFEKLAEARSTAMQAA